MKHHPSQMFLDRLATMRSGPSSWQKGMDVLAETLNHLVGICGLTQLNSVAYGCVPLVSRTDGPTDTEIDANPAALAATVPTGFQMNAVSPDTLAMAVRRTVAIYRRPQDWMWLQTNGMGADFSWDASGAAYDEQCYELIKDCG